MRKSIKTALPEQEVERLKIEYEDVYKFVSNHQKQVAKLSTALRALVHVLETSHSSIELDGKIEEAREALAKAEKIE